MKKIILLLAIVSIVGTSCKKNAPTTPPPQSSSSNSQTTNPPTTPTIITQYSGKWYLDTIKTVGEYANPISSQIYTCIINYVTSNPIYYWHLTTVPANSLTCGGSSAISTYSYTEFAMIDNVHDTYFDYTNTYAGGSFSIQLDNNPKVSFTWSPYPQWCWGINSGYFYAGDYPWFTMKSTCSATNLSLNNCVSGNCNLRIGTYYYHFHR